ncbi:ABC transporter permease [Rhodococcus sp. 15-649-1-2]|nr:ABC transporter permease [Rhodococcus sp. 15-649-1-2]
MKIPTMSKDVSVRVGLALAVFVVFAVSVPGYASTGNVYAILESCALIGIVAAGLAATMLAGELDLSVGSVAACAGVVAVQMAGYGVVVAVISATVIAIIFGALQGILIARLGISSLVFTLGTFIGLRGVAYVLSNERTVTLDLSDLSVTTDLRERLFVFSPFSITMIVIVVAVGCLLQFTRIGREIYAVGAARKESRAAGVSQNKPLILAFTLSAGLAAVAGSLASLRSASATPDGYATLLVTAVTAALIGGISLYGGRGTIVGVFVGVLTLQFLLSGLALQGAPFWASSLATGAVLLAFLAVDIATADSPLGQAIRRFRVSRRTSPPSDVSTPSFASA